MRSSNRRGPIALVLVVAASVVVAIASPSTAGTQLGAWAWGGWHELGNGTTGAFPVPVLIGKPGSASFTTVSVGGAHSLGLASDGTAWAWGSNYFGQLGDGGTTTSAARPVPVHVPAGVTFVRIAAGAQHSLAVDSSGRVWAWGWNDVGQLGDGTTMNRSVPVLTKLPPTVKIRSVAAEAYESFAVDRRGHVWQWGNSQTTPARVRGWPVMNLTIVQLATSELHVLALALNGTAYAWGDNEFGQLGDGTTISRTAPVAVHMPAGMNLMTIGAGSYTSYAVDSTGSAWAWGDGDSGALGNGSSASSVLPLAVSMPAGVTFTQVLGSAFSGLALDSNGTAWSWGDNSQGTLGDGTTTSRSTPGVVRMPAGTVRSLAGESYAVVALARAAPPTDLVLVNDGGSSQSPWDESEHLSVGNSGSPAAGVTLTYTLPPYTMFLSATPTQGTCQGSTQQVTCHFGTVIDGAMATVDIRPLEPGSYTHTGTLSVSDATPADNQFSSPWGVSALNNSWRYVADFDQGFDRPGVQSGINDIVQWNLLGSAPNGVHDATGLGLFDSGTLNPPNYFDFTFHDAGTYVVADQAGHSMPVKVPPRVSPRSGDASTLFEIGWGVPPSGDVADVQVAFCAASTPCTSFTMWRHGTPGPVADFGASDPAWQGSGTYYFRARVRQATTGAKSDWSPVRGIVVA